MTIKGVDSVDTGDIYPGDTVKLKKASQDVVGSLLERAEQIGCILKLLNYGEFYFKEVRSKQRDQIIDDLLK